LGTQVNLSTNVQSEFFTGTTDADLPWVQSLGPENPPVPVLMISGWWDDILSPDAARLLYEKLGGDDTDYLRGLVLLPVAVHNYEPFSTRAIEWSYLPARLKLIFETVGEDDQTWQSVLWLELHRLDLSASCLEIFLRELLSLRTMGWILGFSGMLLALIFGRKGMTPTETSDNKIQMSLISSRWFLWGKLLLWLGALPVAGLLGSLFFIIPLGKPVFNLIYVGFIGGYGILLLILYWRGKMHGVQGKLPFVSGTSNIRQQAVGLQKDWKRVLAALGIALGMLVLTAAYARTGWFYVFPVNVRLVWLVVFTPFTALGFWIGLHEGQMVRQAGTRSATQLALTLIGLFPFFLYTLLMAALGSLSGMIGGLQGLLILWLVLAFGSLLQAVGRRPWLTAVCMAVLLYWLILPQGVLF